MAYFTSVYAISILLIEGVIVQLPPLYGLLSRDHAVTEDVIVRETDVT